MTSDESATRESVILSEAIDIAVRLVVVFGLLTWCFLIFQPFALPVIWGTILAVALFPLFEKFREMIKGKNKTAATLFTLVTLAIVLVPTFHIAGSLVETAAEISEKIEGGDVHVSPPSEKVKSWPIIGEWLYDNWRLASTNFEGALKKFAPQLRMLGAKTLDLISGVGGAVVQSLLAILIMGLLMATSSKTGDHLVIVARRLGGETGVESIEIARQTIRSVAQGVLGVAVIQGFLCGIGMFLISVPAWGLWTVLATVLAIVQLPPLLVMAPVILYVFSTSDSTVVAVVFAIWSVVAGGSDAFLKPMFLGRGMSIPMPVILIGALGGMVLSGFIGLFVGAVVLAIGYKLFLGWLDIDDAGTRGEDVAPDSRG